MRLTRSSKTSLQKWSASPTWRKARKTRYELRKIGCGHAWKSLRATFARIARETNNFARAHVRASWDRVIFPPLAFLLVLLIGVGRNGRAASGAINAGLAPQLRHRSHQAITAVLAGDLDFGRFLQRMVSQGSILCERRVARSPRRATEHISCGKSTGRMALGRIGRII